MEYLLVFKNGYQLTLSVKDGKKFLSDLLNGSIEHPERPVQICCMDGVMVRVDELVAAHPKIMIS